MCRPSGGRDLSVVIVICKNKSFQGITSLRGECDWAAASVEQRYQTLTLYSRESPYHCIHPERPVWGEFIVGSQQRQLSKRPVSDFVCMERRCSGARETRHHIEISSRLLMTIYLKWRFTDTFSWTLGWPSPALSISLWALSLRAWRSTGRRRRLLWNSISPLHSLRWDEPSYTLNTDRVTKLIGSTKRSVLTSVQSKTGSHAGHTTHIL